MAKIRNIYGEPILSGPLGNRLVQDGQIVEISEELAKTYIWGAPFWEPVKEAKPKSGAASNDESQED